MAEYIIRRANTDEVGLLTDLAFRSKSYWNYSKAYLDLAKHQMKVTEVDINSDFVYVAVKGNQTRLCGFYHLKTIGTETELVWLGRNLLPSNKI